MLAALDLRALLVGLAAGGLAATVVGLVIGVGLALLGVDTGPDIGLLAGVLSGMFSGGLVAGRIAVHSHRFHGSVGGLLLSGIVIFAAAASGAGSAVWNVLLLALVGIVIGGVGGWLGGRTRPGPA